MVFNLLPHIFKAIFGESLDPQSSEHRRLLQSTVYLLEELGVGGLNYCFAIYNTGMYSQELFKDITSDMAPPDAVSFAPHAQSCFYIVRSELLGRKPKECTIHEWMECLAATHFFMTQSTTPCHSPDELDKGLRTIVPHLKCTPINHLAFDIVRGIFG